MTERIIEPDYVYLARLYALRSELPKGIERVNRDWAVSEGGDMRHVCGYTICASQAEHPDWLLHLQAKRWFDANTFLPAYMEALIRAGHDRVTIITHYPR